MKRFAKLFVALSTLPIIGFAAPVFAGSPGQLAQGNSLYQVKLDGGSYSKSVNASCNNEVVYSMQLSNTGFSDLTNVTLTASLPSSGGTSTATATTDLGGNSGTHDSASVNLNSGSTQSLVSGTTVLYDGNGSAIMTLPDTITSGVNVGTIHGSTTEYVNFKAKINCETPVSSFACTELGVVQIDRTRYDFTAKSSVSNATVTSYVFTVKNANGTTIDTNTVTTNATSAVYHFNQPTGTYKVNAVVNTDKGSTKASDCEKQITVAPTPPTTPPTTIPNTGAGDVLGIFAGASAAGTAAHAIVSRRRR